MKVGEINPYIRLAKESVLPKGAVIGPRVIYDYEIIYLRDGGFTLIYDGKTFSCKTGDIILIEPGITHQIIVDSSKVSQPHIHFDLAYRHNSEKIPISFKNLPEMSEKERNWIHDRALPSYPTAPFLICSNKTRFLSYFDKVVSKRPTSSLIRKGVLLELLGLIFFDNFWGILREENFLTVSHQVKNYLDQGNGLDMTLDEIAELFSYSKFHLEKAFKEYFKISVINYRNNIRMKKAQSLLLSNSASKTAKLLGYKSIQSFSRAYKNYYNQSPASTIRTNKNSKNK